MKLARSLLLLTLAVRVVPAADTALTDFFPAGTKVVFGINLRQVVTSPLAKTGLVQARKQIESQPGAVDWLKLASLAGFDPLRDIDVVLVATTGEGQNPPALIVATGRFDVEKLGAQATRYHDVPLLGGGKPTDGVIALLSESIVLAGDRPTVLATIDHMGSGPRIDAALAVHIGAARARYDVWGLGDRPEGFVAPTPQANGLESIDRFQFGLSVSHGLELGAEVHARSAKDAEQIGAMLGMVQMMIKSKQPADSAAKFDVQTEDGTFKMTMTVPEAEVLKAMQTGVAPLTVAAKPSGRTPIISGSSDVTITRSAAPAVTAQAKDSGKSTTAGAVYDKEGNTVILTLPGVKK